MKSSPYKKDNISVPSRKLSRILGLGGMTATIAGNMLISASKKLASGDRIQIEDLLITKKNILAFTKKLSQMRGAALKVGQLLSLESEEFLPNELAIILSNLRNHVHAMPTKQLEQVLMESWGPNYLKDFAFFEKIPLAAASIGQVHKCKLLDGRILAVKVQYPGIKDSIDSDMDSLGFIISKSGILPSSIDFPELLRAGRDQLHKETDYVRESHYQNRFYSLVISQNSFEVPQIVQKYITEKTLAMEFKEGKTIDSVSLESSKIRNKVVHDLIDLFFQELFKFRLIQSDPNYANFLFNHKSKKIVLLDFGATISVSDDILVKFKNLFKFTLAGNKKSTEEAMYKLGILDRDLPNKFLDELVDIYWEITASIRRDEEFDFGQSKIIIRVQTISNELIHNRKKIKVPLVEVLSIQRKIVGIFLLARRLKSHVNIRKILKNYI